MKHPLFNITNPEQALSCPGIESDYWISFYNGDTENPFWIDSIAFIDETMTQYQFDTICQSDGEWRTRSPSNDPCPDPDYLDYWVPILHYYDNLYPYILPDCVYNYPNEANNGTVIVTDGMSMNPFFNYMLYNSNVYTNMNINKGSLHQHRSQHLISSGIRQMEVMGEHPLRHVQKPCSQLLIQLGILQQILQWNQHMMK